MCGGYLPGPGHFSSGRARMDLLSGAYSAALNGQHAIRAALPRASGTSGCLAATRGETVMDCASPIRPRAAEMSHRCRERRPSIRYPAHSVVVVEAMMPFVHDHDLGKVGREAQLLLRIRGTAEIGIFEGQEPGEVIECRTLAKPLVVVNVRNPFGKTLLR